MANGIIFDLDGTLLDTLATLAKSHNHALEQAGYLPHPVDSYRLFVGDGARKCVERSLPAEAREPNNINRVLRLFQTHYGQHWREGTRPYAGMTAVVSTLLARGDVLGVLSNKDHPFTCTVIGHFFPDAGFAAVQGHTADIPHKPDPAGALAMARAMGLPPAAVTIVGDTRMDIQTGHNAGMRTVGVTWGFRQRDELEAAGAHDIVDTPQALIALTRTPGVV